MKLYQYTTYIEILNIVLMYNIIYFYIYLARLTAGEIAWLEMDAA